MILESEVGGPKFGLRDYFVFKAAMLLLGVLL